MASRFKIHSKFQLRYECNIEKHITFGYGDEYQYLIQSTNNYNVVIASLQ